MEQNLTRRAGDARRGDRACGAQPRRAGRRKPHCVHPPPFGPVQKLYWREASQVHSRGVISFTEEKIRWG